MKSFHNMHGLTILVATLLSVISTSVMSYITLATPIGPWIAPTLVLIALLIFKAVLPRASALSTPLALTVNAGSIGGIVATAFGFTFPTLFFLDEALFTSWLSQPIFFMAVVASLTIAAAWFGLLIADRLEHSFIVQQELSFPIGTMVYKMIAVHDQVKKSWELVAGVVAATLFGLLQDGAKFFSGVLPRALSLVPKLSIGIIHMPALVLDLWPMLWAIGFITGHVIAIPLGVGALAKIFVVDPINHVWFSTVSSAGFILAFCSGMVVAGAVAGLVSVPKMLRGAVTKIKQGSNGLAGIHAGVNWYELGALGLLLMSFLSYFKFGVLAQIYLLIFTLVCTYQITHIAGKIGLAQLGRFATFVMVPGMMLFGFDFIQITLVATFVELTGGVATDVLFGRKLAHLAQLPPAIVRRYQMLGLVVSALTVGVVFWVLATHFGLGSTHLFAQRAQARALLVQSYSFDHAVLGIGFVFGYFLKKIKLNPMLVLGGLLMPLRLTLGLLVGGGLAALTSNKENWYPFWSGVFAANALWMLIQAVV